MKKIVITQLVDNSISIYGVFNTFKDAYVQFNRFNENILKNSGYEHYKDKVRAFTKAVRDNHVFVKRTKHHFSEDDAINGVDKNSYLKETHFYVSEVDTSKVYLNTNLGIMGFNK
jgi:hypothetical protein